MQARLQEIRDRYNFITNNPDMVNNRVVYPTMRKITDDVGFLLDALEQAQDRERVLRDALTKIYNATAPDRGLTMHETTQIYCIAREALKEDKP